MSTTMLMETYLRLAERDHAELTALDQAAGDGDFGDNLRGALRLVVQRVPADATARAELAVAATCFLDEVGGTSGPLIGLLLQEMAAAPTLVEGLTKGIEAVQRVGEAKLGDRTMLDCLIPARDFLVAHPGDLAGTAEAAARAALSTSQLRARAGRASYVGERAIGTPDAGATGMALFFAALAEQEGLNA
ncbi:DAK2 domain-containing protein [Dactylosporangium sp. CA-233914]|uniref:DAK2 domain-containing protein n=1 Tax=Dactylosporangium sp. CA-233914 TaxID=3239934 RepID=UPI003D917A8F